MASLPRLAATILLVAAARPAHADLPDPVRAMIAAAMASGEEGDVETVTALARATNPADVAEIDALVAVWRIESGRPKIAIVEPMRALMETAIDSGKDADVEAVAKLAKATDPEKAAPIQVLLADYRAQRKREKAAAAAAEYQRLAQAKLWENWKGEGQIGATHSSGNSNATGVNVGLALTRKGIDWNQRLRAQVDYQRTDGRTTLERYLVEYEPQIKIGDRAFAYGFGRWERDEVLGYTARWNVSGGLGYKLLEGERLSLSLKAGPAWRQTDFVDGYSDTELTALAGLDFGWQLSPTLRLTQVASTIVGESNMSTSSLTSLNAKLTGALSARIAYSAEIDTRPPPGIENVDTLTRFTLVYGF